MKVKNQRYTENAINEVDNAYRDMSGNLFNADTSKASAAIEKSNNLIKDNANTRNINISTQEQIAQMRGQNVAAQPNLTQNNVGLPLMGETQAQAQNEPILPTQEMQTMGKSQQYQAKQENTEVNTQPFGGNTVGAAQSNPNSYDHLVNEHGAIEPGENPIRNVDVPKKVGRR